jgi:hypothetical protein
MRQRLPYRVEPQKDDPLFPFGARCCHWRCRVAGERSCFRAAAWRFRRPSRWRRACDASGDPRLSPSRPGLQAGTRGSSLRAGISSCRADLSAACNSAPAPARVPALCAGLQAICASLSPGHACVASSAATALSPPALPALSSLWRIPGLSNLSGSAGLAGLAWSGRAWLRVEETSRVDAGRIAHKVASGVLLIGMRCIRAEKPAAPKGPPVFIAISFSG